MGLHWHGCSTEALRSWGLEQIRRNYISGLRHKSLITALALMGTFIFCKMWSHVVGFLHVLVAWTRGWEVRDQGPARFALRPLGQKVGLNQSSKQAAGSARSCPTETRLAWGRPTPPLYSHLTASQPRFPSQWNENESSLRRYYQVNLGKGPWHKTSFN